MNFSRRAWIASVAAGLVPAVALAAQAKRSAKSDDTGDNSTAFKGAIVLDAATGAVILQDRSDYVGPPASVTKLMTFLVVHDRLQRGDLTLQTPIVTTAEAAKTGGSQVYLAEKEIFPVEELLFALMIASANDAATALAIHVAGSKSAFVELMNERAKELGMADTVFRSPHGLPPSSRSLADSDVTSPRDLAKLSLHLLRATDILKYTSVHHRVFRPGPKQINMDNHNNLLGKVAGVDGLKTGFTRGAGFCLAATALRKGRRLVVVTMGSPDSKTRDLKIAELLEKGFAKLPPQTPQIVDTEVPIKAAPRTSAPAPATPPPPAAKPAGGDEPVVKFTMPPKK